MPSQTTRSWGWILAELTIVVAGILIAFALNSFWENRSTMATEQAHLHALRADFAENVSRLEQMAQRSERTSAAARDLLLIARGVGIASDDSTDSLIGRVFNSGRFEAVMGAYEGLVNSGGLAQLRDDTLRTALATFASALDSRYVEEFSAMAYLDFNRDFVGRLGWSEAVMREALGEEDSVPDTQAGLWNQDVLDDADFQGHLGLRSISEAQLAVFYRSLSEQARVVLDRIETVIR